MLKRIAVVGEGFQQDLDADAVRDEIEVVRLKPDDELPVATAAVVVDEGNAGTALDLALKHAARQEELLDLLAMAIAAREQFSPEAASRLKEHATRFAEALGLDNADRLTLERGALVHDIGKLRIPNDILLKKTVLTFDEWTMLQSHAQLGADLISGIEGLRDTEDMVRRHHCCFDGTGYPDGLEGEDIPFLARVMKILDVYCAMTSPRHYRQGHSTHEEAVEYLQSESGKHFDAELIRVFIESNVGRPLSDEAE